MRSGSFYTILITAGYATGQAPPIPDQIIGWTYDPNGHGFADNAVELEVFLDFQCYDSMRSWPGLKDMANHYGREVLYQTMQSIY